MMQKKSHPKFVVPGYNTRNRAGVKHRWRKQRGVDNKKRIGLSGYGAMPHIGYKNMPGVRFMRADGKQEILVHNESELVAATKMDVTKVVAVISHDVSTRKRIIMQAIAEKAKLRIANMAKEKKVEPRAKKAEKKVVESKDNKVEEAVK